MSPLLYTPFLVRVKGIECMAQRDCSVLYRRQHRVLQHKFNKNESQYMRATLQVGY
jgi:hypothetical protein